MPLTKPERRANGQPASESASDRVSLTALACIGILLGVILLQFVGALAKPDGLTAPALCSAAGCDAMAITKGVDFGLEDACLEDDCPRSDSP